MVERQRKKRSTASVSKTEKNNTDVPTIANNIDPVSDTQNEVKLAYQNYVKAQKDLLIAFKEQAQQQENAYKNNEKSYQAYEELIEKAFENREKADSNALESYRKTVEKAGAIYMETTKKTFQLYKQTIDQMRQASSNRAVPARSAVAVKLKNRFRPISGILARIAGNTKIKSVNAFQRVTGQNTK